MLLVSCKQLYNPILLIASQLRGLYLLAALTVIPYVLVLGDYEGLSCVLKRS